MQNVKIKSIKKINNNSKRYDLEVEDNNNFFANDILVHNCRLVYKDELFTRQGKEVTGFEHIEKELIDLCQKYNLNFIDGELFTDKIGFQKIQGTITRDKNINVEDKKQIFYNIFYIGKSNEWHNTEEMVNLLDSIKWEEFKYLKQVKYVKVKNNKDDIEKLANKYIAQGFEGLMLRNPNNAYSKKRDDNLLKVKFFIEEDFKIVDFNEGNDKYTNTLGALVVEGKYEGKSIKSQCGSGYSDEDRDYIWKNKEKLLGKMVEIKFQNITDSPDKEGNYSLRFPIYNKLKLDRG